MIGFCKVDAILIEFLLELIRQIHLGRGDKRNGAIELAEGIAKRMHRAHAHITNCQPLETVNAALFTKYGVQVGENLCWVLAPAVTTIDDGNARPFRGFMRRALLKVAHHDHVAVELEHFDRVLDGLLIEVTGSGHFCIGEARDVASQTMHGSLMS